MAKAAPPVEDAVGGKSPDRRKAWEQRMRESGFKRVGIWVPEDEKVLVSEVRELLASGDGIRIDELRQFFQCDFEFFAEQAETDDERAYWRKRSEALAPRYESEERGD